MWTRLLIKRRLASTAIGMATRLRERDELRRRVFSTAKGFTSKEKHIDWHLGALSLATAALLIGSAQQQDAPTASCDAATATAWQKTTEIEPKAIRKLTNNPKNVMLHRMRSLRARTMTDKYKVDWDTVIGEGAYGSVHPARLALTGEKVALKKISKRYTNSTSFKTETDALLRIYDNGGHPNISGLRDMYEDGNHFYLILDLVSGGEMFEHLINYGAYSEADAARLMYEVASALAFLHGVGVVHADLKPENLLLDSKKRIDGVIKMIDFGCSIVTDEEGGGPINAPSANSNGTTAYWPPERFQKGCIANKGMDMWAVGVILYIMLTGVHPFDLAGTASDEEIEVLIQKDPYPPLGVGYTDHLSPSGVDLIKRLMEPDPDKRITAYEMINHSWVRGETASSEKIQDSDKRLSRFKALRDQLDAGIFAVLVHQGHRDVTLSEAHPVRRTDSGKNRENDESTNIMKKAFDIFDQEGKGFVTSDDLGRVVSERIGHKMLPRETRAYLATRQGDDKQGDDTSDMLSLSTFQGLFAGIHHKHFPRGHVIFRTGDTGDAMYFLNSGKVQVQTRKGQLVAELRSGDFFGEGSLLSLGSKRFTTARCATPVDVIEIKREDFERYVASSESTKNELQLKWRARNLDYAKTLIRLQTNVKERTFLRGDVIYREGEVAQSMYQVNTGELEVSHGGNTVHMYKNGDSFGESSLLFERPRSSTVKCRSAKCTVLEMKGEHFLAVLNSSPEMGSSMRNMALKRLFKKAVKQFSLQLNRGLENDDIVATFHDADMDRSGTLSLDEVRRLMHHMDPEFPMKEINALMKFIDVDEDGGVGLDEFKRLFRQFEEENV